MDRPNFFQLKNIIAASLKKSVRHAYSNSRHSKKNKKTTLIVNSTSDDQRKLENKIIPRGIILVPVRNIT